MKDILPAFETKYRPRWIAGHLRQLVERSPVVVLTGARQVGKTTLMKSPLPHGRRKLWTIFLYVKELRKTRLPYGRGKRG